MSALEEYAPLNHSLQQERTLSSKSLLAEFRNFAFNNAAFRAGMIDLVQLRTIEGDELEVDAVPTDEVSVGYEFEATRLRNWDRPKRSILSFSLTVIAIRDAIEVPAHIAMNAYGIDDPEEAVMEAGKGSVEHKKRFTIGNTARDLQVCESYQYADNEGDILARFCTCEDDTCTSQDVVLLDSPESELPADAADMDKCDSVAAIWTTITDMEMAFGAQEEARQYDQNLLEAHHSLLLFKRGLQRQLGL